MAVDYFLIEAPRIIPEEYADWQNALAIWRIYANAVLCCEDWSGAYRETLSNRAFHAKWLADDLERIARDAFHLGITAQGTGNL